MRSFLFRDFSDCGWTRNAGHFRTKILGDHSCHEGATQMPHRCHVASANRLPWVHLPLRNPTVIHPLCPCYEPIYQFSSLQGAQAISFGDSVTNVYPRYLCPSPQGFYPYQLSNAMFPSKGRRYLKSYMLVAYNTFTSRGLHIFDIFCKPSVFDPSKEITRKIKGDNCCV